MKYKYHHNEAQYIYQDAIAMIEYMTQLITLLYKPTKYWRKLLHLDNLMPFYKKKTCPKIYLMLEQYAEQFVWKVL